MKTFILAIVLILSSLTANADIDATYASGKPSQIYSGIQPNDKATRFIEMNIGMTAVSERIGLSIATGYNFHCDGDQYGNPGELKKSTDNSKTLAVHFGTDSPDRYFHWESNIIDTRLCRVVWTATAIGTRTSTGTLIDFSFSGSGPSIGFNITSTHTSPVPIESKKDSHIFSMFKEPDCRD